MLALAEQLRAAKAVRNTDMPEFGLPPRLSGFPEGFRVFPKASIAFFAIEGGGLFC
jgi:hypothetical protein